ncbi:MAG: hypothetical protein MR270_05805 [Erysipelotrichaceae bacterium]|nr:hypothetical protein [Erysipelotrichaceae bacterium]
MLSLLAKDFKIMFSLKENRKKQFLSVIFNVFVILILIALETVIFQMALNKIKDYYLAPISFLTLFLFIVSILMMVFMLFQAKKLFFNKQDIEQLSIRPVSNSQIIFSKLIFLFLMYYTTCLMFTIPLFISYGVTFYKSKLYYYLLLFYPFLAFLFEMGIALIFVYPLKLLLDFLKKHIIVQFIVAIIVIFACCFLYSKVLTIFIQLVANNQIQSIFSTEFINKLNTVKKYFIPTNFLIDIFISHSKRTFFFYLLIALGVFTLGLNVAISSFKFFKKSSTNAILNKKEIRFNIVSPTKALIKKELMMIFKDSNYILSYSGLLIVQPFLAYLVIYALNTIFRSGVFAYYITLLPNFLPLIDILLMMLFTLIIASGANSYLSMEQKNVRIMKTIPVSLYKQLFIKVAIPFICSLISLFISVIVLVSTHVFSITTGIFTFLLSSLILFIFDIVSLFEELKIKRNKIKNTFMSSLYSYLLPLVYFIVTLLLSYVGLSIYIVYLLAILCLMMLSLPYLLHFKTKVSDLFLKLELVN